MGADVARVFPGGNAIGPVGSALAAALWRALGLSAVLVPPLLALGGLRAGEWLSGGKTARLVVLTLGLALLVPAGAYVLAPATAGPGWLGAALGRPLVAALGWLGTLILLVVLLAGLTVVTLGWRPVRRVGDGVIAGSGAARTGLGALATRWSAWRADLLTAATGGDPEASL